ncbi:hypothetical protein CVD28_14485 [Bacillus sp. M6-12]|uniref:hypothetical protein n=1 Tax=Bacillus sp. M6-12 TaxID=2054166 RepID=UPI000C786A8B|nr:hypothetical protein [Bacillus sp. M6-12]PLS16860.1 hypothetical protein CVD28_14485 [Bacillus sp. M6-12]
MLVEINLLPKKERKKAGYFLLILLLSLLMLGAIGLVYWQYSNQNNEIETLENQIQTTKQIIASEEQKLIEQEDTDSVAELNRMVKWAETYPIETVRVLRHLISLLPERGFFLTFDYKEDSVVGLSVQFDTSVEAAYYLKKLTDSEWVLNASMVSLTTAAAQNESSEQNVNETVIIPGKSTNEAKLPNDPYLPRYVGQYEIHLDNEFIKETASKEENNQEKASPNDEEENKQ